MKKKILKYVSLSMVLSMMFSMTALASQSYTQTFTDDFSKVYFDSYNVSHTLTGSSSCLGTIAWDEGISGWIVSAHFNSPSVYIDGSSVGVTSYGTTVISGSYAYQQFKVNNSDHYLTSHLSCNEYGDASYYTSCN